MVSIINSDTWKLSRLPIVFTDKLFQVTKGFDGFVAGSLWCTICSNINIHFC